MFEIEKFKSKILYKKAKEVLEGDFGEGLDEYMSEMITTMYGARGVGLAGPQVGDSRRILVADLGYVKGEDYGSKVVKMVNPQIISFSEEEGKAEEGCLSYPGLAVSVKRPLAINVKFFSPYGVEQNKSFSGWQARIISHEIDHLDGVTLFSRSSSFAKQRYMKKVKKGKV